MGTKVQAGPFIYNGPAPCTLVTTSPLMEISKPPTIESMKNIPAKTAALAIGEIVLSIFGAKSATITPAELAEIIESVNEHLDPENYY